METIKKHIQDRTFKGVYLLYGETYLKRQFRDLLQNAVADQEDFLNYHYFEGKDVSFPQIIEIAQSIPFMAVYKVIVIENSEACNQSADLIADYIPDIPESTILIFVEEQVKKTTRLYKAIAKHGYCAWFQKRTEREFYIWIQNKLKSQGKNITREALQLFVEKTSDMSSDKERKEATKSTEMDYMNMELEKVICYAYNQNEITIDDVETIVIGKIHNRIFEMIAAIVNKRQQEALKLYYDLISLKESPLGILALLTRQFHYMYQVKLLKEKMYSDEQISQTIRLQKFIVAKYVQQVKQFSTVTLREALVECVETDITIKSGRINEHMGIELIIIKYSSKKLRE